MKILITGASGRVAHHILNRLARQQIIKLSRSEYIDDDKIREILTKERPEAVIHLASILGQESKKTPRLAKMINTERTAFLAQEAQRAGVKTFIFSSTAAVYHQTKLEAISEEGTINPSSIYAQTKRRAEEKIEELSLIGQTNFVVFRIFNIYGPRFNDSLVNRLITSTESNPTTVLGPDNYYRDYIHVSDVASAFVKGLSVQLQTNFNIINIASGKTRSNSQLIQELRSYRITPHFQTKSSQLDISWGDITKAKKFLNFNPATQLNIDGIT